MTTTPSPSKHDDTTRSPLRTVHILHELSQHKEGLSLASLSQRLALPKTSLFRMLKSLEVGNYVVAEKGVYRIGAATLKLGASIVRHREFPNCAVPVMASVSQACDETIILGTLTSDRTQVLYAEVIDARSPLRFISTAGSTNPLYGSASGQILLAHMSEDEREAYIKATPLVRHAPGTLTSAEQLRQKLASILVSGYSESLEGLVEGVYSIAAPVLNDEGKVIAGLSISAPSSRGLPERDKLLRLVMLGGEEISRLLGYTAAYPKGASQAM